MDILKLFFFLFINSPLLYAQTKCTTTMCPNTKLPIHFPFQLNTQQSLTCAYPGFNLHCTNKRKIALHLPYSGEFFVRSINYRAQAINLYDPLNCLPRRLLSLSLIDTPFEVDFYQNFTFLICPSKLVRSHVTIIDCLSNSTNSIVATSSPNVVSSMEGTCEVIFTVQIPVSFPGQYEDTLFANFREDLVLRWSVPYCEECEVNGGTCGFKNSTTREVSCLHNHKKGKYRIFKIIALVSWLMIICSFGLSLLVYNLDTRRRRIGPNTPNQNFTTAAVTTDDTTVATIGLDGPAFESYWQVVLGENGRLPGPNNDECPICLSDYNAKETVRYLPECQHCFHSDCIDEWLRLKGTCPICRMNSPNLIHNFGS